MGHVVDRWTVPDPAAGKGERMQGPRWGKGKRWAVRWMDDEGREHLKAYGTKSEATIALAKVTVDVLTGEYVDERAGDLTILEWSVRWLETKQHLRASTLAGYRSLLDVQVLPTWGSVRLNRVRYESLQRWVSQLLAGGLSATRVRQAANVMHQMLESAVRARLIARNPGADLELPALAESGRTYLTHGEVARLAAAVESVVAVDQDVDAGERDAALQYRVLVLVLAYTGVRWGEACALRVRDVDLMRRRITVARSVGVGARGALYEGPTKTGKARAVPVPKSLVDDLTALLAGREPGDLVFASSAGTWLRNSNFRRRVWLPALEQAGLPPTKVHELRHTAASLAIAAGADVKVVQQMLGHATAAMTLELYGHLLHDRLDDVSDRMDAELLRARTDQGRTTAQEAVVELRPVSGSNGR
jgi:integrase